MQCGKVNVHSFLQISYASTSVVLSDRSVYRNFYRTVPSDELLVPAVAAIMDSFGWRQLSVFTEEQSQFIQVCKVNCNYSKFWIFAVLSKAKVKKKRSREDYHY